MPLSSQITSPLVTQLKKIKNIRITMKILDALTLVDYSNKGLVQNCHCASEHSLHWLSSHALCHLRPKVSQIL